MNDPAQNNSNLWDVFVSHSSRIIPDDEELIGVLVRELIRRGNRVFLDRLCLTAGLPLLETLENAISVSSVGLLVLTQQAGRSGWVEFEIDCMKQRRAAGRIKILALDLDDCRALPHGMHADEVINPKSRIDILHLANEVERAVHKAIGQVGQSAKR